MRVSSFGKSVLLRNRNSRSQMFLKTGAVKNFAHFIGKHLRWSLFLEKLQAERPAAVLKKRLQHMCFPVTEHLRWMLQRNFEMLCNPLS